jgi:Calcineurin-like phosphoesterase
MSSRPASSLHRRRAIASCWLAVTASAVLGVAAPLAAGGETLPVSGRSAARADRVVAIGDIHGDFDAFLGLLTHVGLIDAERRWTGRGATLVQTGDYMDRGPKVRPLLDFLMTLEAQAAAGGGRAIVLMGNHEASNAIGVLRDVPASAFAAFADAESEGRRESAYGAHVKLAEARRAALGRADAAITVPKVYMNPEREAWMAAHPPGFVEYLEAFGPQGTYGKWIRTRMVLVRVNDTIFLHGGINPEVAPKKLESLNEQAQKEITRWDRMRKQMIEQQIALPSFTFEELLEAGGSELTRVGMEARRRLDPSGQPDPNAAALAISSHPLAALQEIGKWAILDPNGPLWFRGYATWRSDEGGPQLDQLQRRFGPVRFVVGHTMTSGFRAMARFSSRVFLIDTGMLSSYYQGGRASALEIQNGTYAVVTLEDRRVLFDPMSSATR